MAETPKKAITSLTPTKAPRGRRSQNLDAKTQSPSSSLLFPQTPLHDAPRRSSRRRCQKSGFESPGCSEYLHFTTPSKTPKKTLVKESSGAAKSSTKNRSIASMKGKREDKSCKTAKWGSGVMDDAVLFTPISPDQCETKKRKRDQGKTRRVITRETASEADKPEKKSKKSRVYYKKVMFDGCDFEVGDDVYVKRREDGSDDEEPEVEDCQICFKQGKSKMIECDDCLGGFHLKCLTPPLKEVPEGDWVCAFCEAKKSGRQVALPTPPSGKKRARTLREKFLSSDLWAARIESLWKETDGSYWFRGRWYIIPEETNAGRQPHNLRRELYQTNDFADIEMLSIIRHCSVMNPKEYAKATEGDDVFFCEYEYDIHQDSFKRLAEIDDGQDECEIVDTDDENWGPSKVLDSDTDEDLEFEDENEGNIQTKARSANALAANTRKGHILGLQKIGTKKIPKHVRCHKQTELEKAKAKLLLARSPKFPPCRNKEVEDITKFIKGAICDGKCLGRCLYIHGVPGTGKTMSVHAVMRNLRSEADVGSIRPYSYVEVNALKLASPENIYQVIYEALTGHRVGWKKALELLTNRFSDKKKTCKEDDRPCILVIDELDHLLTRNQSVLYDILDWPNKPSSKLIVIGIANTMDLPEKLLPSISSRLGDSRLCFVPYNYKQLQEIISSRLKGINAFELQAIEFASRKVAAASGDVRRALEICRRAAEIADYRIKTSGINPNSTSAGNSLVGISEVQEAVQEMFNAHHIQLMRSLCKYDKIFLTAMVYELYKTGTSETTFEKVAMTVLNFCNSNGETFPGFDLLLPIGGRLGESRIILCESIARHRLQKLQLNYPSDDVVFALKDSTEPSWLSKYL